MTRTRRSRSRLGPLLLILVIAAAVLALLYGRCGSGLGFGPGSGDVVGDRAGEGATPPGQAIQPAVPARVSGRCQLRLAEGGLTLDGAPSGVDAAVAACARRDGADLVVTGGARQGDADALRAALERAKIPTVTAP